MYKARENYALITMLQTTSNFWGHSLMPLPTCVKTLTDFFLPPLVVGEVKLGTKWVLARDRSYSPRE